MGKELLPDELARHVAAALLKGQRQHWEVSAVPGAGKTTFLVHLLTVLLEHRVRPEAIMVLSFANSTVNELDCRIAKVGTKAHLDRKVAMRLRTISGRTFHSFAQTVLSEKNAKLLLGRDVQNHVITAITRVLRKYKKLSATEANTSLVSHLHALLEDADRQESLRKVFDLARSSGRSPDALAGEVCDGDLDDLIPVIPELLRAYTGALAKSSSTDFAKILQDATDAGKIPKFDYVLVDEYQDCTEAQRQLLKRVAEQGAHVVAVGDINQALYRFLGAEPATLKSFLPAVGESHLTRSFRLSRGVSALANALSGATGESAIQLDGPEGTTPVFVESSTYVSGLKAMAQHVRKLLDAGAKATEIAILARTNQILKDCEDHLLRESAINTQRVGLNRHPTAVATVLELAAAVRRRSRSRSGKLDLAAVKKSWRHEAVPPDSSIERGMTKLALAYSRTESNPRARLDNIFRLCADAFFSIYGRRAEDFKEVRNEVNRWEPLAANFLSATAFGQEIEALEVQKVNTCTMHSAKGMEWKHVLVFGVTDGLCPIYFVKDDDDQGLNQERNTLYVAITRAIETLRLFHAPRRHPRSRRFFQVRSRLLSSSVLKTLDMTLSG